MTTLVPRLFGRLDDLLDWDPAHTHLIRVEESVEDNAYKIRAELPGMEPADIKVSVDHGMLSIDAERTKHKKGNHRTEFRYGALHRSATLPPGADEANIHASYDKGILEVTIPVAKKAPAGRTIAIETAKPESSAGKPKAVSANRK
ncbi:Hsp20/alpha crystallin family protein [Catelliglobosispora koreensis]|uniref:Hsp20/alpha crystallin family protein n=1 Tax=Catelliglobosispora koreensis TaxID=129052 RepID=UPI00037009B6|nr:Hsp20/alpha crystallin family protein [Catelliglobosispora koreensis]